MARRTKRCCWRRPLDSMPCRRPRIRSPRRSGARCGKIRTRLLAARPVRAAAEEEAAVAVAAERRHRVGIGWRPELAAGIFAHLDRIDVVEVIVDNYFRATRRELDALRALAQQVPVQLHGVGLGLASAFAA